MSFSIYIAASYRHLHAVRLLAAHIEDLCQGIEILDWTTLATPPDGLTAAERRAWMDTDHGGTVYDFCVQACTSADLVIYLGTSGQDAGVEVGMAAAAGVDVIGLAGPLESAGLMLHGAVNSWAADVPELLGMVVRWSGAGMEEAEEQAGEGTQMNETQMEGTWPGKA